MNIPYSKEDIIQMSKKYFNSNDVLIKPVWWDDPNSSGNPSLFSGKWMFFGFAYNNTGVLCELMQLDAVENINFFVCDSSPIQVQAYDFVFVVMNKIPNADFKFSGYFVSPIE
jgi:hypothetical protein